MFIQFREIVKKDGWRGWRLEKENNELYLSKFDDRFNDDEFRFFLSITNEQVQIKRMQKIKSYKKVMNVSPQHDYAKQAETLCVLLSNVTHPKEKAHA